MKYLKTYNESTIPNVLFVFEVSNIDEYFTYTNLAIKNGCKWFNQYAKHLITDYNSYIDDNIKTSRTIFNLFDEEIIRFDQNGANTIFTKDNKIPISVWEDKDITDGIDDSPENWENYLVPLKKVKRLLITGQMGLL